MKRYVADASALLMFLEDSVGASMMQRQLERATDKQQPILMSVLSWGELYQIVFERHGAAAAQTLATMEHLPIELVDVDLETARLAAQLSLQHTLPCFLCVPAALAQLRKATLLTSERSLAEKFAGTWLCAADPDERR